MVGHPGVVKMKMAAVGLFALFGASLAQADVPGGWLSKATELGILATLVLYFTWQSGQREKRMADAIREMEKFQTTEMASMMKSMIEAITANTDAMHVMTEVIQRCRNVQQIGAIK